MKTADRALRGILQRIADGTYPIKAELPPESDIAAELGMSRLSVREAMRELIADGVIAAKQGRRHRIAPTIHWSVRSRELATTVAALEGGSQRLVDELLEARQVLEVEICRLAATRITDEQLEQMQQQVDIMESTRDSLDEADIAANVAADLVFHQVIVDAARNRFLATGMRPLADMLFAVREQTSRSAEVRTDALHHHRQILAALTDRDPGAAADAMAAHMDQTMGASHGLSLS